jgi:hypothetical protein
MTSKKADSNSPSKEKTVHRSLHLASPRQKGADVSALQSNVNQQYKRLKIDRRIEIDGTLGGETFDAAEEVALCLGVCGDGQEKLKRHVISEGIQRLIRGGRDRTAEETAAGHLREYYRKQLRARYAKSAGEKAIERSNDLVGVHEEPAGSNWGGKVGEMIKFTGYAGPVYWCGCCAAWIVIHLGGAKIPNRIRLGYAPYITADALVGTNGLTAVPVEKCQAGDLGSLWGGEHVVTVRGPVRNGMVPTREGNTSASDGSQSNGGEVADKERPVRDFDRGIVARPDWN